MSEFCMSVHGTLSLSNQCLLLLWSLVIHEGLLARRKKLKLQTKFVSTTTDFKGPRVTEVMVNKILQLHASKGIGPPDTVVVDTNNCSGQFKSSQGVLTLQQMSNCGQIAPIQELVAGAQVP